MSILSGYFKCAPPHAMIYVALNLKAIIHLITPNPFHTFESITFVNVSHKSTQNMVKYETEDNPPVFFSGLHR